MYNYLNPSSSSIIRVGLWLYAIDKVYKLKLTPGAGKKKNQ